MGGAQYARAPARARALTDARNIQLLIRLPALDTQPGLATQAAAVTMMKAVAVLAIAAAAAAAQVPADRSRRATTSLSDLQTVADDLRAQLNDLAAVKPSNLAAVDAALTKAAADEAAADADAKTKGGARAAAVDAARGPLGVRCVPCARGAGAHRAPASAHPCPASCLLPRARAR